MAAGRSGQRPKPPREHEQDLLCANVHGACEHGTILSMTYVLLLVHVCVTTQNLSVRGTLDASQCGSNRSPSTTTAQKHTDGPHNVALSDPSEQKHSHQSEAWLHVQSSAGGRRLMPRSAFAEEKPGQEQSLPPAACSSHRLRPVLLSPPSRGEAAAGRKCVQRAAMRASGGQLGL